MAEIERWITVNGAHVPIMKGESKMAAVGKFIKSKRKDKATRLKEFNEKLQKHEGKEDYLKWGMKNYPVKTIYGNTLTETRKRNQEKYNELYEKNEERLKKYSKEELLERASGKIQTGDGEQAYKKSWIQHDLAHYNTKKEFIPERDKYKGKSYKLKEDKVMTKSEKAIWDSALKTAKSMADKNTDINALAESIYNRRIKTKKNDSAYKRAARNDRKRSYGDTSGSKNIYRS